MLFTGTVRLGSNQAEQFEYLDRVSGKEDLLVRMMSEYFS